MTRIKVRDRCRTCFCRSTPPTIAWLSTVPVYPNCSKSDRSFKCCSRIQMVGFRESILTNGSEAERVLLQVCQSLQEFQGSRIDHGRFLEFEEGILANREPAPESRDICMRPSLAYLTTVGEVFRNQMTENTVKDFRDAEKTMHARIGLRVCIHAT